MRRFRVAGADVVAFEHDGIEELVASASGGSAAECAAQALASVGATPLRQLAWGTARRTDGFPATHAWGRAPAPPTTGACQLFGLAGTRPVALTSRQGPLGCTFEDDLAAYAVLGGVAPSDNGLSLSEQVGEVFGRIERLLDQGGMDISHVARTWFFIDRILDDYADFNAARTDFFRQRGLIGRFVPASTGVGAANSRGSRVVADVLAIRPKQESVTVTEIESPLQCAASNYGSSFSRAVEIRYPGHRRLLVSGTASIDPDGRTVHTGDVGRQIAYTMAAVQLLLESRDMDWADVSRGIGYFKHMEDVPAYRSYLADQGLADLPVILAHADICREELLFEIEIDAIRIGA